MLSFPPHRLPARGLVSVSFLDFIAERAFCDTEILSGMLLVPMRASSL
jgi:hypothetical protein